MKQSPLSYCIWLLSRREYSEKELRQKLVKKEIAPDLIDATLERLKHYGYQSDTRVARQVGMAHQTKGLRWLKAKLATKGVGQDVLDQVEDLSDDESRLALALARFEAKDLSDEKTFTKATRYLLSRGFSYDKVSKGLKELRSSRLSHSSSDSE